MELYFEYVQILNYFTKPFRALYYSQEFPILGALLLGIIGALAPCQVSANVAIISYCTNRLRKIHNLFFEIFSFFLGKTLVYFILGLLTLFIGGQIEEWAIPIFQVARKITGPFFLFIGLYFLGVFRIHSILTAQLLKHKGSLNNFPNYKRGFLGGILISLAFCPTMALLFFGLLIPLIISNNVYGMTLPVFFSVGTFVPVLIFLCLVFSFGTKQIINIFRKIGGTVQVVTGVIFILIGVIDILFYWILGFLN